MLKFLATLLFVNIAFANDMNHMYKMMTELTSKNYECQQSLIKAQENNQLDINNNIIKYKNKNSELEKKLELSQKTILDLREEISKLKKAQPKTKIIKKIIYRDITSPECKKVQLKKKNITLPPSLNNTKPKS